MHITCKLDRFLFFCFYGRCRHHLFPQEYIIVVLLVVKTKTQKLYLPKKNPKALTGGMIPTLVKVQQLYYSRFCTNMLIRIFFPNACSCLVGWSPISSRDIGILRMEVDVGYQELVGTVKQGSPCLASNGVQVDDICFLFPFLSLSVFFY